MKFLYINNELCADCGKCESVCPTTAIYCSGENRYINYDKCVSCGNCFRECLHKAISIEKLEKLTREMDNIAEHKRRVDNLEKENRRLKEELETAATVLQKTIEKLPVAVVVLNGEGNILHSNHLLAEYLDYNYSSEDIARPNNFRLHDMFPENVYNMLLNSVMSGESVSNKITELRGKKVSLSIHNIEKGKLVLGIIRDLTQPNTAAEESIAMIKESIDRQMGMVQKIGFLLGEEASEISKNLNSVIKVINSEE